MAAFINFAAIGATTFRSDSLGPLDSVAHPLDAGAYRGDVWRGDAQLGSFLLEVAEEGDGEQIEVDLCTIDARYAAEAASFRGGRVQGQPVYAVFHCDSGTDGLYVIVRDRADRGVVFDSRVLQPGDYYIVTPVRPGTWAMQTGKNGKGVLTVAQPKPAKKPRASAAGAVVEVDGKSFAPAKAEIVAGDGVAFHVTGKDVSIRIELEEKRGSGRPERRKVGLRIPGRLAQNDETPGPKSAVSGLRERAP